MAPPRRFALALVLAAGVGLGACGGATDSGLFSSPPAGTAGGDADASVPTVDGAAPVPSGDAGNHPPTRDAAPPHDAAPPPQPDAAPSDPGVRCGPTTCDPRTTVCCRIENGPTPAPVYSCLTADACNQANGFSIPCDDAQDCATAGAPSGEICCLTEDPQSGLATTVQCDRKSNCQDQTQTWMCDPAASGACPSGDTCTQSTMTIPGYTICHP